MDQGIQKGINDQIRAEFEAAYIYLAKSAHFTVENYDGFARWMRLQAEEELTHAMRLFGYLLERGGRPELESVSAPSKDYGSPLETFEDALEHERQVTATIHELYALAREKHDYATEMQLQWFITEQVEEEANADRAVQQLRRAGDESSAILLLDHQFGQRTGA